MSPESPHLEVLVLGPLAVRLGGNPVAVDRPLERALLVRLALAGGLSVPDHRLATDLWGDVDLTDLLVLQGELDEAASLLDAVFAETPDHSTSWLAARAVAAALALAQGNRTHATTLVTETITSYTKTGFARPRYSTRLDTVRAALSD